MNRKVELHLQKKQAELDEWNAEVDKLKAKASGASDDAWESIKQGLEPAWDSMRTAFSEAAAKYEK